MVNLVNASRDQRPKSNAINKKRTTSRWIRDLIAHGLWPIIALLLVALALIALATFPGIEPTGSEILIGP
jgi:hypothetical protein